MLHIPFPRSAQVASAMVVGLIVADLVTHPEGTSLLFMGAKKIQDTTVKGLLGESSA